MAAPDPFNSAGGYTVGIPPLPIVAANGDVTAGNISGDNLNVTSTIRAGGDVYGNTFYGKFAGSISGGLTVPGLTTQVLYNVNGNAAASSNFTFNSSTSTLTVNNGYISSNAFVLGAGTSEFSTTRSFRATTSSTNPDQILTTIQANTVCGMDYTIIATDLVGDARQTSKLMATVYNQEVDYYEYGTIDVPQSSGGVADFKVGFSGGNINLTVTPLSNNVDYKIMITSYKE
jgi:hypothetical protein